MAAAKAKKTEWSAETAITTGSNTYKLASQHRADLEPRLEAGLIDHLAEDVATLRGDARGTVVAKVEKTASTSDKGAEAAKAAVLVGAIRKTVKENHADDKAMQKTFGVGTKVVVEKHSTVTKALGLIVAAAANHPDQFRAAGLLPADLERVKAALLSLDTKVETQSEKKLTAKQATAAKLAVHLRVEQAFGKIQAAAGMAFLDQPEKLKLFEELVPGHASAKPAAKPAAPAVKKEDAPKG
jgi:hypothetical protein